MLKIPGVGNKLSKFKFLSIIDNNQIEVTIIYVALNQYGAAVHKMQNYELRTDVTHPNLKRIKQTIDKMLKNAAGSFNCKITVDGTRNYVEFNNYKCTGNLVL